MARNTHKLSFMKETMMERHYPFTKGPSMMIQEREQVPDLQKEGDKDELEMNQGLGKSRNAGDHLQLQRKLRFHEDVANHGRVDIFSTPHSTSDKKDEVENKEK